MNTMFSDHESADESITRDNPYCFSSCNSMDIEKLDKSVTRTRRRKSSSEKGNRVCVVCAEKASGFNFDRLTCESCKAFFRRNAMKPREKMKPCPQGGGCSVSGSQRKHCPYCRLEKCFSEGMKKELILPPEKLEQRAKPKRRKTNADISNFKTESVYMDSKDCYRGQLQTSPIISEIGDKKLNICSKEECMTPPPALTVAGDNLAENCMMESHIGGNSSSSTLNRRSITMGFINQQSSNNNNSGLLDSEDDRVMLASLSDCVSKLKEPFTPQEHPDTETAHSLEEAYNRMDTCIRRIIRLVKLLPSFFEMDKQMQLTLLRTNIYGLIIIYSSFFFEKEIKKLCYPVLSEDGNVHLVTVSVSPSDLGFSNNTNSSASSLSSTNKSIDAASNNTASNNTIGTGAALNNNNNSGSNSLKQAVQEDFELYKENTIAAFTELQELTLDDNVLKVLILVIKLFDHDNLPQEMREHVRKTRAKYSTFLMRYLRVKHRHRGSSSQQSLSSKLQRRRNSTVVNSDGSTDPQTANTPLDDVTNSLGDNGPTNGGGSSIAILHFSRMLMSFIDIGTLEIRMIEFSKLLSLDGLSPLMREVCSHRAAVATNSNTTTTTTSSSNDPHKNIENVEATKTTNTEITVTATD